MKRLSIILGTSALALIIVAGPRGKVLVKRADQGKVSRTPDSRRPSPTVRSRGPSFIWLGGGFHGGK